MAETEQVTVEGANVRQRIMRRLADLGWSVSRWSREAKVDYRTCLRILAEDPVFDLSARKACRVLGAEPEAYGVAIHVPHFARD